MATPILLLPRDTLRSLSRGALHKAPVMPRPQAELPAPVLRHGSPPAQRMLPLRRAG